MSAMLNLILILVAAVFAILAGAALLGAGAFVVASLGRWRKARKAAHHGDDLMVVADAVAEPVRSLGCIWPSCTTGTRICTPDEPACEPACGWRWFDDVCPHAEHTPTEMEIRHTCENPVGHRGQHDCGCGYWIISVDAQPTQREKRIPVPARPNELGGWVRIGDEKVHRSCEQAYPAGLVCSYCLPILVVHARSVTS